MNVSPRLNAAVMKYERAKAVERVLDAQFIEKLDEVHDATNDRAIAHCEMGIIITEEHGKEAWQDEMKRIDREDKAWEEEERKRRNGEA